MQDPNGILIQQTENVQAARQMRFASAGEISKLKRELKAYIFEAIELEKSGIKVELKKTAEFEVAVELQQKFDEMPEFKAAFEALTPGRQRGYHLYFTAPKQAKTRISRVEKSVAPILNGKGLND